MKKHIISSMILSAGLILASSNANANDGLPTFGMELGINSGSIAADLLADVSLELSNQLEASLLRMAAETSLAISLEVQDTEIEPLQQQTQAALLSKRD